MNHQTETRQADTRLGPHDTRGYRQKRGRGNDARADRVAWFGEGEAEERSVMGYCKYGKGDIVFIGTALPQRDHASSDESARPWW